MLGQTHHFVFYNRGKAPYAEQRYLAENARIYKVLNERLAAVRFLGGEYSIADIATWPWISRYERQQMDMNDYPNLKRWYLDIASRPAVQRGYHVPNRLEDIPLPD
jgi:GST-like protein